MKLAKKYIAILTCAGSFICQSSYAQTSAHAELQSGTFLSHWDGYRNSWTSINAQISNSQNIKPKDKPAFQYSLEVISRTDSTKPVLGNINQAEYFLTPQLSLGRAKPRELSSRYVFEDRLNHRICQNALECATGGPIGAHFSNKRFSLSAEILTIPNLSALPKTSSAGSLSSDYRWTTTPYQLVEIDGKTFPLRISSNGNFTTWTFLTPGIQGQIKLLDQKSLMWTSIFASHRSHSPRVTNTNAITVVEDSPGELVAVVNNDQDIRFPWHNYLSSVLEIKNGLSTFFTQQELSHNGDLDMSTTIGWKRLSKGFSLESSVGFARKASYKFGFGKIAAQARVSRWSFKSEFEGVTSSSGYSILLMPKLSYDLSKTTSLFTSSLLIYSLTKDEKIWSSVRGQDYISLGVRHEI
ncbi:hypothetical protein GW916_12650 [bacterium]|nr:hypothetical protein [bacterium]